MNIPKEQVIAALHTILEHQQNLHHALQGMEKTAGLDVTILAAVFGGMENVVEAIQVAMGDVEQWPR